MCWIFIHVDTIHLSTEYVLDIYHTDMTPISINSICLGYLSSWYVSEIYSCWYSSNFYQL